MIGTKVACLQVYRKTEDIRDGERDLLPPQRIHSLCGGRGGKALGLQGTNQAAFTDIFLGVAVSTFGSLSFKTPFFISASILD